MAPKTVSEGSISINLGLILGVAIPISLIGNFINNESVNRFDRYRVQAKKEKIGHVI